VTGYERDTNRKVELLQRGLDGRGVKVLSIDGKGSAYTR
jgi:hypothetical protein